MLFVDPRQGSQELVKPLRDVGLKVDDSIQLDADLFFTGKGEKGTSLTIAAEHKKVPDLISSLTSKRLQGLQMPRMLQTFDRNWLIIEGDWQSDSQGRVTMWKGRGQRRVAKGAPPAIELEKRLLTLELRGGFRIRHCPTRKDTVRFISALYRWWTDVEMEGHRSHLAMHEGPDFDQQLRIPVSDFRQAIAKLDAIGYRTSEYLEKAAWDHTLQCGSWEKLRALTVEEIAELTTRTDKGEARRIGMPRAIRIRKALR